MKTLTESYDILKKKLRTYPNWKMMYKVLRIVEKKELIHMRKAMKMLGIYPIELVDIVTILDDYGLIELFSTMNEANEHFSHFKITSLGKYYLKYMGKRIENE